MGRQGLDPGADGTYTEKAPRALLEILTINTSYHQTPRQVDLRGDLGDAYRLDVILSR